jgi:hypothetical protein
MGPPWQDKVQQQGESPSSMWSCERGGSERTMSCDSLGSLEVDFFYFILIFPDFSKIHDWVQILQTILLAVCYDIYRRGYCSACKRRVV